MRTHIKEASTITGRCLFIFIYISLTYIREIDDFYKQHVPQRVIYSTSILYTIPNF